MRPSLITPLAVAAFAAAALVVAPAYADTVHTKNGTVHEGKIVSMDAQRVVIETEDYGRLPIARSEIDRIEKDDGTVITHTPPKPKTGGKPPKDAGAGPDGGDTSDPDAGDEGEGTDSTSDQPLVTAPEPLPARRWSAKIVRRTQPGDVEDSDPTADDAKEATVGGAELGKVPPGTDVLVFMAKTRFELTTGGIVGRRIIARTKMSGVATAWLSVRGKDGEETLTVRLGDVLRHVVLHTDSSRLRILEGITPGDWLRAWLDDGTIMLGRLDGYADGVMSLTPPDAPAEGEGSGAVAVPLARIVQLDGLRSNPRTAKTLRNLEAWEPVALVSWPKGDEIHGRFVGMNGDDIAQLDTDGDGASDVDVDVRGPVVKVRRIPERFRALALEMRAGDVVRTASSEQFPDARVDRVTRGRILALNVYTVCIETDEGAAVVPFDLVTSLQRLTRKWTARIYDGYEGVDAADIRGNVPILPGDEAKAAAAVDEASGVSALTDGAKVTHVFVAAPFAGTAFGVKLGQSARAALEGSELDFDMVVTPRNDPEGLRVTEMISDSVKDLRLTLLLSPSGAISAVEITSRQ